MITLSSWGRLQFSEHELIPLIDRHQIPHLLSQNKPGLPFGMGRSYGDVCLNPGGILWKTSNLDRFIHLDEKTGLLRCEAGILLADIQRAMLPKGWMLPVTPGTQYITLGGAIANDVHGKNYSVLGSFGHQVKQILLLRTDGELIECGPTLRPEWFAATLGGLGLTGVILNAEIQLRPVAGPWLNTQTLPFTHLEEFFELRQESQSTWEYSIAWIDRNARGIFMRGNHSDSQGKSLLKKNRHLPFTPPFSLINKLSSSAFNSAYFHLKKRNSRPSQMHYESFFYPLDVLGNWNRLYGFKGFYQYQSLIPPLEGKEATQAMLKAIAHSSQKPFLLVLKTFEKHKGLGMLSFPQPGVTLALDFPNQGKLTLKLFEHLDAIVLEAGGRIYPAKDARMPPKVFEAGYPRLTEFLPFRDPGISSALSRRLMGQ